MSLHQRVGVFALAQCRHADPQPVAQQLVAGAEGGAQAGFVGVVQQDHVGRVAAQQHALVGAQSGAERGRDLFDPRQRQPQHVEIPFDEDGALRFAHRVLRHVEVVEQLALVEDRRVRRIQVLGLPFPENPTAEAHDAAAQVVNREQEPAPEPGHHAPVLLLLACQARFEQHLVPHAQSFHCIEECGAAGGVAQTEQVGACDVDVAALEIATRDLGFGMLAQLAGEPVLGDSHGREQGLAGVRAAGAALGDRDADAPGHFAHGGRVVHPQAFHIEGEDVARLVADEAVEHSLLGDHSEIAVLAAVERARAAEVAAGPLELDVFTDDGDEIGGFAHLLDDVVGNCHASDRRTVGLSDGWTFAESTIRRTEPTCTTSSPSSRISRTVPTAFVPVRTLSPTLYAFGPTVRLSDRPTSFVFSIASSTMRRACLAVASSTAARAWPSAASTVLRASRR